MLPPGESGSKFAKGRFVVQWIKEGKQAVKMTRLSCHRFRSNEMRLWLTIIAYNLGNLWRRLFGAMVGRIDGLPLPSG